MEDVLDLYAEPDDLLRPVVCLDECPNQLLGDVIAPVPPRPGRVARYDYEYKRGGTGSLFILFCPARAWRHVIVSEHHGKQDFAQVLRWLLDEHLPDATCIRLVVDNLNTHSPASLYTAFLPEEARRLTQKLEWHYTPKHASWLNMVEIELSILGRQCLDRRIPDLDRLRQEVAAWEVVRNNQHATVSWHFTTDHARQKLQRFYPS
jgi:DDE superfamily endonuclease